MATVVEEVRLRDGTALGVGVYFPPSIVAVVVAEAVAVVAVEWSILQVPALGRRLLDAGWSWTPAKPVVVETAAAAIARARSARPLMPLREGTERKNTLLSGPARSCSRSPVVLPSLRMTTTTTMMYLFKMRTMAVGISMTTARMDSADTATSTIAAIVTITGMAVVEVRSTQAAVTRFRWTTTITTVEIAVITTRTITAVVTTTTTATGATGTAAAQKRGGFKGDTKSAFLYYNKRSFAPLPDFTSFIVKFVRSKVASMPGMMIFPSFLFKEKVKEWEDV
jgi:hypothetical protein